MAFHGTISPDIAKGLKILRTRIGASNIPPMKFDETLNIATWNVREFGKKRRTEAAIHYIAEVVWQFGLVAIVELRDNLTDLQRVMRILGPNWEVIFSDFNTDPAGNRERIGYLFDKRAVTPTGLAAEADPPRIKNPTTGDYLPQISFWRSPYMATFRSGNFDFLLLAAHIKWGAGGKVRIPELRALADWVEARSSEKFVEDKDIFVVGDFNIPKVDDELFRAITAHHLTIPMKLRGTNHGSNLQKDKHYDQIFHDTRYTRTEPDAGGVLDFYADDWRALFPSDQYPDMTKEKFTYEMSDHLPLWMHLDTWVADEQIDQVITRSKGK